MEFKVNRKLVVSLLLMIITVIGGTFAWFNYRSTDTALVLTIGDVNGMIVTVKPYKVTGLLTLTNNYQTEGKVIDVTVTNNHTKKQQFNLYFDISSIDSALYTMPTSQYFKYKVVKSLTGNANSYTETVTNGEGDFTSANTTDDFIIYSESVNTNTTYYYKVYIWLQRDDDPNAASQSNLQNTTFNAEFRASIESVEYVDPSGANAPVLTSGMVPVKLNGNGTVVTTVDPVTSDEWYDYSQQKWANAVLVDSTVRSNYINSSTGKIKPGVIVDTSKILAYYVWIPRYSYEIWTTGVSSSGNERLINIKFVNKNTKEDGKGGNTDYTVGEYYTHPAFTFDLDDNASTDNELAGIWVGKFELSHTTGSMSCTNTTCSDANNIRILPNKASLRNNTVSSFFYGIRSMQKSGNSFGLPTDTTTADSHMMKNREWGAVAYLAHSAYGLGNQEVRINSYSSYRTGCGASEADQSNQTTCYDPYGKETTSPSTTGDTTTYLQSTTGDITGVFDMSGGAVEYVMGNYNGTTNSYFSSLPALKYYDKYTVTSNSSCTFAECGGHALKETASWHSDSAAFVYSSGPWFGRGGSSGRGAYAGPFCSSNGSGDADSPYGSRAVVVVS